MARLELYVDYNLQATLTVEGDEVVLGRDPACAIHMPDPKVSRRHAVIRAVEGTHVIENHGSNGTKLNGHPLETEKTLTHGDAIFIGRYVLVYVTDDGGPLRYEATELVR